MCTCFNILAFITSCRAFWVQIKDLVVLSTLSLTIITVICGVNAVISSTVSIIVIINIACHTRYMA